jgi:hypothetical protein
MKNEEVNYAESLVIFRRVLSLHGKECEVEEARMDLRSSEIIILSDSRHRRCSCDTL